MRKEIAHFKFKLREGSSKCIFACISIVKEYTAYCRSIRSFKRPSLQKRSVLQIVIFAWHDTWRDKVRQTVSVRGILNERKFNISYLCRWTSSSRTKWQSPCVCRTRCIIWLKWSEMQFWLPIARRFTFVLSQSRSKVCPLSLKQLFIDDICMWFKCITYIH